MRTVASFADANTSCLRASGMTSVTSKPHRECGAGTGPTRPGSRDSSHVRLSRSGVHRAPGVTAPHSWTGASCRCSAGQGAGATGRWRCAYGPPPALCSEQVRHPAGLPLGEPTREAQPRPATRAAAGGDRPPRSLPGRECSEEQRTPWLPNQLGPLPPRQAGCSSPRAPPQTDAALRGHQAAAVSLGGAGELAASTVTGHTCPRVPRRSRRLRSPAQCTAGHG